MKPKEILQSSFDLLGELMKFNPIAFKIFNSVIDDKEVRDPYIWNTPASNSFANNFWAIMVLMNVLLI